MNIEQGQFQGILGKIEIFGFNIDDFGEWL
jgi:hypothetical protein